MDSVDDYARQWTKREKEDVYTLAEWENGVRSLIHIKIKKNSMGQWTLAQHRSRPKCC